jgi:hypothetical protein
MFYILLTRLFLIFSIAANHVDKKYQFHVMWKIRTVLQLVRQSAATTTRRHSVDCNGVVLSNGGAREKGHA